MPSSILWRLEINLRDDFDEICYRALRRAGYKDVNRERAVYQYFNLCKRSVDTRPRKVIHSKEFNAQKEAGLIDALRLVSQRRGIYNAKQQLPKEERTKFGRRLLELSRLGINPVTIPREWGIGRIPNLLRAYNRLYDEESEMIKQWNDPTR